MAKTRKHKHKYAVDIFDQGYPEEWAYFRTLKKAVRYARDRGLPADRIIDTKTAANIEGLDLNEPQWRTHRELEASLIAEETRANSTQEKLEQEQDAQRNQQVTLIQAGYVPLDLIASRLTNVAVEGSGPHGNPTVTLTLYGIPGKIASQHGRPPFAAFLQALQDRISKA